MRRGGDPRGIGAGVRTDALRGCSGEAFARNATAVAGGARKTKVAGAGAQVEQQTELPEQRLPVPPQSW